ncbi:unnamed protein product [Taenia asiatica]|uniref:Ricin B-type lectin domain-containing protein n=1 Tax=Taenia asiatica TaxID=60517 RepID=A0A0R3W9J3_TAEAS|nr:unnamed protein product [Taenia asiatica]
MPKQGNFKLMKMGGRIFIQRKDADLQSCEGLQSDREYRLRVNAANLWCCSAPREAYGLLEAGADWKARGEDFKRSDNGDLIGSCHIQSNTDFSSVRWGLSTKEAQEKANEYIYEDDVVSAPTKADRTAAVGGFSSYDDFFDRIVDDSDAINQSRGK